MMLLLIRLLEVEQMYCRPKMLDRKYIGIEKEKDYAIIAKTRVEDAESPNQKSRKIKAKSFLLSNLNIHT